MTGDDLARYNLILLATLVASHTGALLHTAVGYRRAGTRLFFTPPRSPHKSA